MTTVGYGDRYPVTPEGRAIAIGLMICGVGMFGALSGIVASLFLGKSEDEKSIAEEVRLLRQELERQRGAADDGQRTTDHGIRNRSE